MMIAYNIVIKAARSQDTGIIDQNTNESWHGFKAHAVLLERCAGKGTFGTRSSDRVLGAKTKELVSPCRYVGWETSELSRKDGGKEKPLRRPSPSR